MQINLTTKHIDLTPTIEEFVNAKAGKLTRYFDRVEQINVLIEKTTHGFSIEIISDVEHHDPIVGNAEDEDMYVAIDACVDKSVRQLTDLKSRLRDNKHHRSTGGKER